jgi:hypothetical protein
LFDVWHKKVCFIRIYIYSHKNNYNFLYKIMCMVLIRLCSKLMTTGFTLVVSNAKYMKWRKSSCHQSNVITLSKSKGVVCWKVRSKPTVWYFFSKLWFQINTQNPFLNQLTSEQTQYAYFQQYSSHITEVACNKITCQLLLCKNKQVLQNLFRCCKACLKAAGGHFQQSL